MIYGQDEEPFGSQAAGDAAELLVQTVVFMDQQQTGEGSGACRGLWAAQVAEHRGTRSGEDDRSRLDSDVPGLRFRICFLG